jgi:hypothetical protein
MTPNQGNSKPKLRFGIMCNGYAFQQWQADCIQQLMAAENIEPVLLIRDDTPSVKPTFLKKLARYPYSLFFYRVYNRFFFKPNVRRVVDLENELKNLPIVSCAPTKKGHSEYFSTEEITQIKEHQLDFILRFAFNIIRGEILESAIHGVWSFHNDDEQLYRGGPAGFWEIYRNDPVNGAILQRLTNKLDAGIILKKGYLPTIKHSYKAHFDQLLDEAKNWPLLVCNDIQNSLADYFKGPASTTNARIYLKPRNLAMTAFWFKMIRNKLRFHYQELFKAEDWNVGVIERPISDFLEQDAQQFQIDWFPKKGKRTYFADPFAVETAEGIDVLFEEYDYKNALGKISVKKYEKTESNHSVAYEIDSHLSYPYIVKNQNITYCIPENALSDKISIHKYSHTNQKLENEHVILDKIAGVDPTIFQHENRWWLFITKKAKSNTHLYVYYSDQLDGSYLPHLMNPVKMDIRNTRPAGTPFTHNNALYRPAQDCSTTYGARIIINKITHLSPSEFKEEEVKSIEPYTNSRYKKGIHTIAAAGNYTVIDGKRHTFNSLNFKRQLKRKLGKIFR